MPPDPLQGPWLSFLNEVDSALDEPITVVCIGGFVVSELLGMHRETSDLDYLEVIPHEATEKLEKIAGEGSELHKKYKLFFEFVSPGIATPPYHYEGRLVDPYPGRWKHLRLKMLDRYDIMLLKMLRNEDVDAQDFLYVSRYASFDLEEFRQRFEAEVAENITGRPETHRITLHQWIEMAEAARAKMSGTS